MSDAFTPLETAIQELEPVDGFEYESPAGNRAARSYIHSLRGKKGDVERIRKTEKAGLLERGRLIDSRAKRIVERIEILIEPHAFSLDVIKVREETRIAAIRTRLHAFHVMAQATDSEGVTRDAERLTNDLDLVKDTALDDTWEEFLAEAGQAKDEAIQALEHHIAVARIREAEAAELERLRIEAEKRAEQEKAERDAAERAAVARAAAQQAKQAAEAAAQATLDAEKRKAADAKAAAEQAAQDAQERHAREMAEQQAAAKRAELELKLAAERAEKDRLAEQAALDRAAREEREVREARERNNAHRVKVMREAAASLVSIGLDAVVADAVIAHIVAGNVPCVRVEF